MFLVNSRHPLLTATPECFRSKIPTHAGAHLLPKLRCNFAEFLNQGCLKRLRILSSPTCVGLRYGHQNNSLRGFSWKRGINQFMPEWAPHHVSEYESTDLPIDSPYTLEPGHPTPGWPTLLRPPFAQTLLWWYRNINLFSIDYAFRPRLRNRLTLRGLTLLRKPWVYGVRVFHPHYRYSCQHTLFCFLQHSSQNTFISWQNAPLPDALTRESIASVMCLAPLHFRRGSARPVSCYAFFKGWLLLSQPPGCFSGPTTFST